MGAMWRGERGMGAVYHIPTDTQPINCAVVIDTPHPTTATIPIIVCWTPNSLAFSII
jgi:hypothetical protein